MTQPAEPPAEGQAPSTPTQQAAIEKFADAMAEASLEGKADDKPAIVAPPERTPEQLGENPAEEAAPAEAKPSRQDEIKARIAAERAKRQQAEPQAQAPVDVAKLKAELKAEISAGNGDATIVAFLDALERDPVGTAEKYKRDPRKLLTALSEDMIRRGSVRQASEVEDAKSTAQKAIEEANAIRQQIAAEREQARLDGIKASYMAATGSADRAPLLSKLPPATREKLGLAKWAELSEDMGGQWDEGIIVDAIEADLADLQAVLAPSQPPVTTGTGRAAKAPPQTLTADLAAQSSGRERVRTRDDVINEWAAARTREALEEQRSKRAARQS